MERATFAAGCFWSIEATFRRVPGVIDPQTGFTGGQVPYPDYAEVKSGRTGHVEAVQLQYDPTHLTYPQLLDIFWHCHDPTDPMRQGAAVGPQYRSIIFYHTPTQKKQAHAALAARPHNTLIQTQILPATTFYLAPAHHQRYFAKRGIR